MEGRVEYYSLPLLPTLIKPRGSKVGSLAVARIDKSQTAQ
jgi:hypothetical protein